MAIKINAAADDGANYHLLSLVIIAGNNKIKKKLGDLIRNLMNYIVIYYTLMYSVTL